ncbi:MAG TPA: hypothetical protein VK559_11705 [Ferruginibacter sp.]|nr:hypothetical protein [Ferruginibacter sp.]
MHRELKQFGHVDQTHFIAFDADKFTTITNNISVEHNWDFFKYYTECKDDIYIYPDKRSLYSAMSVSRSDIGEDYYNELVTIVRSKLISFDSIKWFSIPKSLPLKGAANF